MKKAMRVVPILFLIFGIFPIAQATELEAARTDLQKSLAALTTASKTSQQAGYGKKLQQEVQAFLKKRVVIERKFDSTEFKIDLLTLAEQIDPSETPGVLSKAIQDVASKFESFEAATAGFGKGADGNPESTNSNTNANDAGVRAGAENRNGADKGRSSDSSTEWDIFDYGAAGAISLIVITALGLLVFIAIKSASLQRTTNESFAALPKTLGGVKARQDDLAKQIDVAAGVNQDINQRLTAVHTELRLMSRMLQQANLAGSRPANYPVSYSEPSAPPVNDGPAFPIAADELLRQMHNKSVVVKRDFQNDMLVSDPDGKGELVLIRDSHVADEMQPLFIVPRVTQFQMRQEYYNFYEKYYECANPESGSVWILDPAVVEKVVGGWELREKGRLEVR